MKAKQPRRKAPGNCSNGFCIVGIGASAGGLEALTELIQHLPTDTGLGFVLIQHLDPQHASSLTQILARVTPLPVREAANKLRVQPNEIFVIPPNTSLSISGGRLKLGPRQDGGQPVRSIDLFFESLAKDRQERAIGVVLSGTASDGTVGLEAIKAEGGITFAQDNTARYDSMPRSAVAAGCVDFVLKPSDIAKELAQIAKHPVVTATKPATESSAHPERAYPEEIAENSFKKILLLLRNRCGVDFSLYKSATLQRRITRRIVLNKQNTLASYAAFLRGNTRELDALYSDALISVTSFFRNPEAFGILQRKVFAELRGQRGDEPVRVWVLGCSTGQEAYSIAMAFSEVTQQAGRRRKLQVFATDVHEALLEKGRHGLYAKSIAQEVGPERLGRFFVEEEGGYRVIKELREMIVFARQNLISDPPFSRMDLICCRNVLIYLKSELQHKVLPMFHYALKPDGFLFLGTSESVGAFTNLFKQVDRKQKIYSRKAAPARMLELPVKVPQSVSLPVTPRLEDAQAEALEGARGEPNAQREADRVLVNYAPPGVLINADLQILQFRGITSPYLQPPTGKASFDILKMAREGLMMPLRTAIHKAKKEGKTVRTTNIQVRQNGKSRSINLEVIPLKNLRERCFLVLFDDTRAGRALPSEPPVSTSKRESSRQVKQLETELAETRDYLQSIQEQHEASSEELQASNEEVQSANEELQSLNEELETSKEELESANEELTTLNEELANRNVELQRSEQATAAARDYAESIIRSVPEPLLVLDASLRVYTANEAFYHTFQVSRAESSGRLIYELGNRQWDIPKLRDLLENILPGQNVFNDYEVTHDFENLGRRTMVLNARKLDEAAGQPSRILLGIRDITQRKRLEEEITTTVENQQERLGQELHDGLAQELTGIRMLLEVFETKLSRNSPTNAKEAARLVEKLGKAQLNTRELAKVFFPIELERNGLLFALQELALHNQQFGVSCVVEADPNAPVRLKDERAIHLFRIAQEAVHNAIKHAGAKCIQIRLSTEDGAWILTIRDDGRGLSSVPGEVQGMGLRIMDYRARIMGGTLEVRNDPAGGVIVSCTAPATQK